MEFYTRSALFSAPLSIVSIPNGMEFYPKLALRFLSSPCFNSQRDGILRRLPASFFILSLFQFPTGWNSTCGCLCTVFCMCLFQFPTGWNSTLHVRPNIICEYSRFNSQRDGILHKWSCLRPTARKVSIPNGMEFYFALLIRFFSFEVSIPNGMEFYSAFIKVICSLDCFNSQRDGILRCETTKDDPEARPFQFPTGWNSTKTTTVLW